MSGLIGLFIALLGAYQSSIISTFFESYQWAVSGVFGVMVVLFGNLVVLTPADTLAKAFRKIRENMRSIS